MGFLDNLFIAETKNTNEKKLVDVVEKIDSGENGLFVSAMNDLGSYIDKVGETDSNMRKMAYAYARRTAAAGLCAQGIWGQEEFDYTYNIFKSFQQMTEQTVEFQELAGAQALEFIASYDPHFKKELQHAIVAMMMQDASKAKNLGIIYTIDQLLDILKKAV